MFLIRNKKINVYPCKPQFYCIKVGFKGSKLYRRVFVMFHPTSDVGMRTGFCLLYANSVPNWKISHNAVSCRVYSESINITYYILN